MDTINSRDIREREPPTRCFGKVEGNARNGKPAKREKLVKQARNG